MIGTPGPSMIKTKFNGLSRPSVPRYLIPPFHASYKDDPAVRTLVAVEMELKYLCT